jgi:rhamnulose-1-phosphate aldolase
MSAAATVFDQVVEDIGEAAEQLMAVANDGTAGNISVFLETLASPYRPADRVELPTPAPAIGGGWLMITAAGYRLRDVARRPESAVVALHIHLKGEAATIHAPPGEQPSADWITHIAVHDDHRKRRGVERHAVLHARPRRLVFLSHLPEIGTSEELTERIARWGPEAAVVLPGGVELAPFDAPGSDDQVHATVDALARSNAVVWSKHGVVTRSDESASHAAGIVEYLETAAGYEFMNLSLGSPAPGLESVERSALARSLGAEP